MSELSPPATAAPPDQKGRRPFGWLLLVAGIVAVAGLAIAWSQCFSPDSGYRRGRQALMNGDREIVLREAERLLATPGYELKGHLLRGLMLSRSRKVDEALPDLEKASHSPELAAEASTAAARCFYSMGRYLEAIDAANAAIALDASSLDARRWLAAAYYDLGAVSHAVVELERINAEAPSDAKPSRLMGLIAKDGEQFTNAVTFYEESLRRAPDQPERETVLLELAECQVKLGRFDDALGTLKQCSRSATALTWEAECQSNLGQFETARDRLNQAIELDRRYFPARLALGKLLLDKGEAESAVKTLQDAIPLNPNNSQAYFQLSQALRLMKKDEEADAALQRMREIQALEREFTDLHEKAASQPTDADIRYRTGELALKLGKPQLAQVWFRAALAINPNHAKARAALGL